jgi:signal transduction histidine kinase
MEDLPAEVVAAVFDVSDDAMAILRCDRDAIRCIAVNRAWYRVAGVREDDAEGRLLHELWPSASMAQLSERVVGLVPGTTVVYEEAGAGAVQELEITLRAVDHGGRHLLWVGRDVAGRRRAEREAAGVRAELERSNADLAAFAAAASHDLQEPLRMIASYVELLGRRYEGKLDERADTYIAFASDGARRLQSMVTGLLDYARIRTTPRVVEVVDLSAVVSTALCDLDDRIKEERATVEVGALPTVHGDAGELGRVVQNLVSNALKFHGDVEPQVRISVERDAGSWRLIVDDNGIGIPPEERERMFDMFVRGQSRARYSGTGLGLALCRSIVERHGGHVSLDSSPLGGTRAIANFPNTPADRTTP